MAALPSTLRNALEKTVVAARDVGEAAARAALGTLAVERDEPYATLPEAQRRLRRALRAKARQLGGGALVAGIPRLVEEIAYQQWHRMLFARFLAENGLLIHPREGVPVTLEECAELAPEEGAADAWELAARYTSAMLPGILNPDDPAAQVRLAPEDRHALEGRVQGLPAAVFSADDALGWVYQFWQSKKKDEVNASERKIGGADIGPVTQLFTEDYMVRFLLENSLGAWWAARHPESPLLKGYVYLRYLEDLTPPSGHPSPAGEGLGVRLPAANRIPAAGTFPGWPEHAAQVTVMDPCGGGGHFVLAAFEMLRRMRMEEEGLSEAAAGDAVIRDNLFMLELDPRCTQIAAFALVLAAWKAGGYRALPAPQIACSGIAVEGQLEDWLKLADGNQRQRTALERLYHLFRQAPTLGSLIDPTHTPIEERMFSADYEDVAPLFEQALRRERNQEDPAALVMGQAAQGVARAAKLLAGQYTLVATNVPYLTRGKQSDALREYCDRYHSAGKAELATCFIERCHAFARPGGTYSIVTPQNWHSLTSYTRLRQWLLHTDALNMVVPLGPAAFQVMDWWAFNTALLIASSESPDDARHMTGIDASNNRDYIEKARLLREAPLQIVPQTEQLRNPDSRISLFAATQLGLLQHYARGVVGIQTADYAMFGRCFWELTSLGRRWSFQQSTVETGVEYGGREHILLWDKGEGELVRRHREGLAYVRGISAWNKSGVAVAQMGDLPCTLYTGELFDNNTAVILPYDPIHLPAIWAYCSSPEYREVVRRIDRKLNVTNATLVKVPFDLARWQKVAEEAGPLPAPHSDDPTQWLFGGHPVGATEPLQVAVARLLGYRWPQQSTVPRHSEGRTRPEESRAGGTETLREYPQGDIQGAQGDTDRAQGDMLGGVGVDPLDALADADGIVCLPPVAGEGTAAERLRALLARAYGAAGDGAWSLGVQQQLLAQAGFKDRGLDEWLCDGFFEQHCRLFHNRPFIWHVWDGRKDGFGALVNYHRLDAAALDKLIYTHLGQWIETQRAEREHGVAGADGRLVAALGLKAKLEAIRDGEPPYDIYVRWKPLSAQPIGWDPDLNDGVRLNIRPFVLAGVLRSKFTINWNKDRGTNPDGSERINDRHTTGAEKRAARSR